MVKPRLSKFFVPMLLALVFLMSACSPAPAPTSDVLPSSTPAQAENMPPEAEQLTYADTIAWDAEYDVVVVGFGGAGAATAITAADSGASVLLTEKAPLGHEGGNTRYAAQAVLQIEDRQKGITYYQALRDVYDQSDAIIETFVDKAMETTEWLTSMGAENMMKWSNLPHSLPEFDLPGGDSTACVFLDSEVFTSKFWKLMRENVMSRDRNIAVWFDAPGKELIQDPFSKTIVGIKIEKDGQMLNVRAKNGVVLTTGGFENNQEMVRNYLNLPELHPMGST